MFILEFKVFFYGYELDEWKQNSEDICLFLVEVNWVHYMVSCLRTHVHTSNRLSSTHTTYGWPFFFPLPVYPPILISLFNPKENQKRPRRKVVANCACYRRSFFFFGCTCIITKKRDLNEDFLKYDHSISMFKYRTKLKERWKKRKFILLKSTWTDHHNNRLILLTSGNLAH